jgi:hypothetical protein
MHELKILIRKRMVLSNYFFIFLIPFSSQNTIDHNYILSLVPIFGVTLSLCFQSKEFYYSVISFF